MAIEFVTVVAKLGSSPSAAANSFSVSNVPGALSVIAATIVDWFANPCAVKYEPTSLSPYADAGVVNVNAPLPFVVSTCPLVPSEPTSVNANKVDEPPPDSAAFTHAVPLYFNTCPLLGADIVVSVKLTTLAVPLEPLFVIVKVSVALLVVIVIPEPASIFKVSLLASATILF